MRVIAAMYLYGKLFIAYIGANKNLFAIYVHINEMVVNKETMKI